MSDILSENFDIPTLTHLHEAVHSILCKTRSISSGNQAHVHTSVRENQQKRYWKTSTTGIPFFLYALDAFNAEEIWNLIKNLLIDLEICLSFWFACVILLFIAWASGFNCFWTTQLYQTRWFHAILLPVFIEFSRCISTYSSAKFELFILYWQYNRSLINRKKSNA